MVPTLKRSTEQKVAAIGDLPYEELAALWIKAHGCAAPKGVRRRLLERSASFDLQLKAHGGLSAAGRKALKAAMREYERVQKEHGLGVAGQVQMRAAPQAIEHTIDLLDSAGTTADARPASSQAQAAERQVAKPSPVLRPALASGTRLLREWNGRQHLVDVKDDGFDFDGKTYRSLSAIARKITGAQWSGPRFFGL